jgi:hypothetical protein
VNRYTLQHNKYENVFAFGDAISGDTTRTMYGAQAQNPIVKHNVLQYLHGKECNAIYDGYTYMPFLNGTRYASGFEHLHDYEPASMNHPMPAYGIFGQLYLRRHMKSSTSTATGYAGLKKDHGPPHYYYSAVHDPLSHNQYLNSKQIPLEEVRHPAAQARFIGETPSVV